MRLTRYEDATAFAARAEPFLLVHEAAHCLQLGILSNLTQATGQYTELPYLALVEDDAETVVAVAMRTPPFNLSVTLIPDEHQAGALELIVHDVYAAMPDLPGVLGPAPLSRAFAERWQSTTGRTLRVSMRERIYQLTAVAPVEGVSGQLRRADEGDRALLVRWVTAFHAESLPDEPTFEAEEWVERLFANGRLRAAYLWEDGGAPVSLVCYGAPTAHGMRIGPVYTPPEQRGHGYASACTAEVSQLLLDNGCRFVFLFTDLANPTSNHIYQKIGFQSLDFDVEVIQFQAQ